MSKAGQFEIGQKVKFLPGPRSSQKVTATIFAINGGYLHTRDDAGKERKVRPGAASRA